MIRLGHGGAFAVRLRLARELGLQVGQVCGNRLDVPAGEVGGVIPVVR